MFLELEEVEKKMISIIMSCIWVFISHTLLQGGTESLTLRVAAAAAVNPEICSSSLEVVLLGSTRHLLLQHSSSKPPAPHPRGASSYSSLGFGGVLTEGILEPDGSLSEAQLLQIKTAVEEEEEEDDDDDDEDNSDEGDISTASSSAAAASPVDDVIIQEEEGFAPCPAYLRDAIPAHHHHHHNNSADTSENMKETSASCVILVPPLYVHEFRWPLSQSQVRRNFFWVPTTKSYMHSTKFPSKQFLLQMKNKKKILLHMIKVSF